MADAAPPPAPPVRRCGHGAHRSCGAVAAQIALRSFAVGLALRTALNVIGLARRRRRLSALLGPDDVRIGAFAALFSGGAKALSCVLRNGCGVAAERAAALSGAGAGLSVLLVPAAERRTLVLFALVRAAEFLARTAALTRRTPRCVARFGHWDVLVMCLAAMQVLFAYVACPHTLDGGYLRFLRAHGAKDPRALRAIEAWFRRRPWDAAEVAAACAAARTPVPAYDAFSPCLLIHPGTGCWAHFARYLPPVFARSLALYVPVHALYALYRLYARRRRPDARSVLHAAALLARNVLRSCLFLSFYCATAWLMLCATVSGLGARSIPLGRLTQFVPGVALLFEHPARRMELALYCAPRALESAWNELRWHGLVRPVPLADVALFCAAAAAIVYCHQHQPDAVRGSIKTALAWLWHD